jgi:hypothetical protein
MRATLALSVLLLVACAGERLAEAPPTGVDLSGRWKLNVADSDDPQRIGSALTVPPSGTGSPGASGGRRGRGGGGGGGQTPTASIDPSAAPATLPVSAVSEVLQWPGRELEVKQVGGVAAFTSDGVNRVYQPTDPGKKKPKHGARRVVGWSGASLIVEVEPDDDRPKFEEHYELSSDGQRLVQLVLIKSGRLDGFAMSRVWDRETR